MALKIRADKNGIDRKFKIRTQKFKGFLKRISNIYEKSGN